MYDIFEGNILANFLVKILRVSSEEENTSTVPKSLKYGFNNENNIFGKF